MPMQQQQQQQFQQQPQMAAMTASMQGMGFGARPAAPQQQSGATFHNSLWQ